MQTVLVETDHFLFLFAVFCHSSVCLSFYSSLYRNILSLLSLPVFLVTPFHLSNAPSLASSPLLRYITVCECILANYHNLSTDIEPAATHADSLFAELGRYSVLFI